MGREVMKQAAMIFTLATMWASIATGAQTPGTAPATSDTSQDTSIFAPLHFAQTPNRYRDAQGAPGPAYWQNRADYDLHATLDTVQGVLQGTLTLRYTNHSPDTLPILWFQTEQNAFRPTIDSTTPNAPVYGDMIDQFDQVIDGTTHAVSLEDDGAETKATLPRAIRPGETAVFHVAWHFIVPQRPTSKSLDKKAMKRAFMTMRMGRDGSLYQIAQWYPRVNVYDDLKGWNTEPYPKGEFYLEYGDFTLAVTVPANYVVGATGTLNNPNEVLTATQRARLQQAAHSDTIIHIITADELTNGSAHPQQTGMVTWKFHANQVRDAVFSAAPNYQWDATHWKGIMSNAYYRPAAATSWDHVADMAKLSIQEYSERWFPYPYPQVSVAEGNTNGPIGGGMEYPMISFDATMRGDSVNVYHLITHETGHNWFPMIVGSNERVHEWMDEGFNTFINSFSQARRFPTKAQDAQEDVAQPPLRKVYPIANGRGDDYHIPAYQLEVLRRDVLGPKLFDKAFRTYIKRWAYKHPAPADFFRTMSNVSGKNLDWFWHEWFYTTPGVDQGIDSVTQTPSGSGTHVTVTYGNHAHGVMPLLVRFTFADGTTKNVSYPVDVWRRNSVAYVKSYTFARPVTQVEIDPEHHLVDTDRSNNSWTAK